MRLLFEDIVNGFALNPMYGMIAWRPVFRAGLPRFRVMHQREAILSMTLFCKGDCLGASLSCCVSSNVLRELLLGFERHLRSKRWLWVHSQRTVNHLLQPRYRRRHAYLWHDKISSDCCRTAASSSSSALCLRRPEGQCSTTGSGFLHAIKHSYHSTQLQGTDAGLLQKLCALLEQNEPEHALMHAFEQMNVKLNTELVCDVLRHQKDLDMAYRFFSLAAKKEGYEHSLVVYNLMLSKLAIAKPKVAYELVLEMINSIGCSPEGMVLDLVLEGLGIAGFVDEAFTLIGTLGAEGFSVNLMPS
ncbi:hypothetical protein O6H91_05G131600 [Diphasiastrum complanatum]|uniref:Uncharacterized protein n=1 Tax=Diphasiastrum complanatum TaxID=34168 RepID=A0ACC2DTJ0_DIPCM|nr:hypothetical protein O6H91_05G131600 [Diphasiastrum complanatum]